MYDAQIQDADIYMPHKSDRDYPIRSSLKQAKKNLVLHVAAPSRKGKHVNLGL